MANKLSDEEKATNKANKLKRIDDERVANNLESLLAELRRSYLNDPTYFFKVGDRVQRGAVKKSIVTEVIDGGKIYKLHEVCQGNRDTQYKDCERDSYSDWVTMRPYTKTQQPREKSFVYESDELRRVCYFNSGLDSLLSRYYGSYAGIDTEPDYQRELVWDTKDKVSLINSIFNKIDIGKFTFVEKPYSDYDKQYEILDGKQRLNAIIEFYEDRFTYRDKTFTELNEHDKRHFRNFPIIMGDTTSMTQQEKYSYFLRLNTGGKPQDQNHINYVKELLNK